MSPAEQAVTCAPVDGSWTVVLMDPAGTPEVTVNVTVGAELPARDGAVAVLLSVGGTLLAVSVVFLTVALRRRPIRRASS